MAKAEMSYSPENYSPEEEIFKTNFFSQTEKKGRKKKSVQKCSVARDRLRCRVGLDWTGEETMCRSRDFDFWSRRACISFFPAGREKGEVI